MGVMRSTASMSVTRELLRHLGPSLSPRARATYRPAPVGYRLEYRLFDLLKTQRLQREPALLRRL